MIRGSRAVLAVIVAAGLCAPVLAQPKDKAPEKKPTTPTTMPAPANAAQPKDGGRPDMQMPPGMTPEDMQDMQACMEAGTPGPMHEWLTKQAGTYQGKSKMWMKPGAPAMESTCTTTITPIYGGRYIRVESSGPMPGGMGNFDGQGVYGFDNVTKEFTSCWWDNMSSGIMHGTGELSSDHKTLTITSKYNCPIQKKEVSMREVWSYGNDGAMTLTMFGPDKTGKEYKVMEIAYGAKSASSTSTLDKPGHSEIKGKPDNTVPGKK